MENVFYNYMIKAQCNMIDSIIKTEGYKDLFRGCVDTSLYKDLTSIDSALLNTLQILNIVLTNRTDSKIDLIFVSEDKILRSRIRNTITELLKYSKLTFTTEKLTNPLYITFRNLIENLNDNKNKLTFSFVYLDLETTIDDIDNLDEVNNDCAIIENLTQLNSLKLDFFREKNKLSMM